MTFGGSTRENPIGPGFESRYCIDSDDVITEVDQGWITFALHNDGESCLPDRVIGRSIWDYIRDPTLRSLYSELFNHVRSRGRAASFPFRCDSPTEQRFQRMFVEKHGDEIRVRSVIERTETVEPVPRILAASPGQDLLKRCSICLDIEVEGLWFSLPDALAEGALGRPERDIAMVHSVCEPCRSGILRSAADSSTAS